jgi:hypothetical protein
MLQRRRWLQRIAAGVALTLLVVSLAQSQWVAAAVFAFLLALNVRGLRQ